MKIARITKYAVVAAAYVGLTFATISIAYGQIQFRVAELLVLLVFFRKGYALPLVLGCAVANVLSPLGLIDVAFGTAGTIVALAGILLVARFRNRFRHPWIPLALASLFPALANGVFVGWELLIVYDVPFLAGAVSVAFGELVVVTAVGVPVFTALARNRGFMTLIDPDGRADFTSDGE